MGLAHAVRTVALHVLGLRSKNEIVLGERVGEKIPGFKDAGRVVVVMGMVNELRRVRNLRANGAYRGAREKILGHDEDHVEAGRLADRK